MSTSMLTFALAGALLAGEPASPAWESSYAQAQKRSAAVKKPMAVFLGAGANGWSQVVREGSPSTQISQILAAKYLCVYVDTTTPQGMKLAKAFQLEGEPGVVLSDATGESQAFWHAGKLTNQGLERYLQKFADPNVSLSGTEIADAAAVGIEAVTPMRSVNPSVPMRTSATLVQTVSASKVSAPMTTATVVQDEKVAPPEAKPVAPVEKPALAAEKVAVATVTWQPTYHKGQKVSAEMKKPMAVAFGAGADGWTKMVKDGIPSAEVTQVLTDKYVCVYVDTATPAGKKLAENFGITQATGVVLSDRSGTMQAFWHQGDLTNQSLAGYLTKYADPQVMVRGTETTSTTRTSFYPSTEAETNWGAMGGSSYCPSCNNARGRR